MSGIETGGQEPQFAAFVGIDWADQKHVWCLQSRDSTKREIGELKHTPEAVEAWVAQLCQRFGDRPIAVALEQSRGSLVFMLAEVAEWANDPLGTNIVPAWGQPAQNTSICASDVLEVGDAIEAFSTPTFTVTLNGVTYHPQDEAFFSWFAHQSPSIGAGGHYSYVSPSKLTSPPPSCT
jgi:Transposase